MHSLISSHFWLCTKRLFARYLLLLVFFHRSLSTTILFSLNSFWFSDRKHFYETFCSHVQRIGRILAHTAITRQSIQSFTITSTSAISRPVNQHIRHTIDWLAKLRSLDGQQLNTFASSAYPYICYGSSSQLKFSDHLIYAMQLMFMPITFTYVR